MTDMSKIHTDKAFPGLYLPHTFILRTPAYLAVAAAAYVRYDHLIVAWFAIDFRVVTSHSCWRIDIRFRSSPW